MANIVHAVAFANNEVAFLAWEIDQDTIPGCLGFSIVREYLDVHDQVFKERPLASYVAFKGQRNPDWLPQNTTVWPVQKFNWRDLTLRKYRDSATRRRADDRVRYRIRAVGRLKNGMEPVVVVQEKHKDKQSGAIVDNTYTGKPIVLGYLTPPAWTNIVDVTAKRPPFFTTFTNGILSTQFLLSVLNADGEIKQGELEGHLKKPDDWLRNYLAGDVVPTMHDFFGQPGGRFRAALYELEDEQLVKLLSDNAARLDLILSDAGSERGDEDEDGDGTKETAYDTRNAPARKALRELADRNPTTFTMQDRLFNGTGHIGHNKFVVHVDDAGVARSVLTGSTNWTWSGVAGQSNNCIRIDNDKIAAAYLAYWDNLRKDPQPTPAKTSDANAGAGQGAPLKESDRTPTVVDLGGGASVEVWFSPNVPGKNQPPGPKVKNPPPPPPDMDRLFSLMRKAHRSIFFLVFMPSRGGVNSIVSEAVALGQKDSSLEVVGAISDTQAMWGYKPGSKDDTGKKTPASSPHVFEQGGVSVIRATALTDKEIGKPLGDFQFDEKLTVGRAIIHDKILVLDPADPVNCTVAFGSHNLGYKASYSNDENLVIVRGHRPLALAYATHVLDVFDHYRFRAVQAERSEKTPGSSVASTKFDGFLAPTDGWQASSSRRLSRYFTETKL
jgi:phosphatidylserine/phosphatidylglycerophosphate/cardiolipin synthase-like enzyme